MTVEGSVRIAGSLALLVLPALAQVRVENQELTAPDAAPGDLFGRSTAVDASTLVVGAPGSGGVGAAYVFRYDGQSFVLEAKLVPPDGAVGDQFGAAVALEGDTAIVGAPYHDGSATDAGAAYVFQRFGTRWHFQSELGTTAARQGDLFGASLAVDLNTLVVGAPRRQAATSSSGVAFVYTRGAAFHPRSSTLQANVGAWVQAAQLVASDARRGDSFGCSVAVQGERIVVGALGGQGLASLTGTAYVFHRSGATWPQEQKLRAVDGGAGDLFGIAVGIDGSAISIGAAGDDDGGLNAGAAYAYTLSSGVWSPAGKTRGGAAGDIFGATLAKSAQFTTIGARLDDVNGTDSGSASLLDTSAATTMLVASDGGPGDLFGCSVAVCPCWTVAGACGRATNGTSSGAAYVFLVGTSSATAANGSGTNPMVLHTTSLPQIGHDWVVEIDGSGWPTADISQLVLQSSLGSPVATPLGEVLLDTSTSPILVDLAFGQGLTVHRIAVPDDPGLIGLHAAVQAVLRAGPTGAPLLTLTNAESLVVGCSPAAR